jgi:F-type H+-transporting ATPase subunit b
MKSLKKILQTVFCLAGTCMFAASAFSGEAAHGEGGHQAVTFLGDWLPRIVNFAVIAAVVVYFARKPAIDFFKNRSLAIAKAMHESQEASERAVRAVGEMEQKIRDLERETDGMLAEARARGEKDKQALVEEGKKLAQDIQNQVKQGIEIEVRKARTALAAEASRLSLDLAEGRIKEKINNTDHERIVKEYISNVGGKG